MLPSGFTLTRAPPRPPPPPSQQLGETNISIFESSTRIGDYTIGELLGEGQFADVKLATSSKSSRTLAVKIMRKDRVHSVQALKRIHNEIAVLRKADHENIVKFHDVILSTKYVYLFGECGGVGCVGRGWGVGGGGERRSEGGGGDAPSLPPHYRPQSHAMSSQLHF